MKHTKKDSNKSKKHLMNLYHYLESDFYEENDIWYLNTKDEVGLSAYDVYKNKMLELKENYNE